MGVFGVFDQVLRLIDINSEVDPPVTKCYITPSYFHSFESGFVNVITSFPRINSVVRSIAKHVIICNNFGNYHLIFLL